MLAPHVYDTQNVANQQAQHTNRVLRSDTAAKKTPTNTVRPNQREKVGETAVCKLDREMDAMTDPRLLFEARQDQRGMTPGPSLLMGLGLTSNNETELNTGTRTYA